MNREILFRGKRVDNGVWCFGTYASYESGEACIFSQKFSRYGYEATEICYRYKVDPETVGQYTGMKDKNGRKIFEGDIIRYCPVRDGEVKTGCVSWSENNGAYIVEVMDGSVDAFWVHTVIFGKCEIIGNVHDNPKLLEGEKK